MPTHWQIWYKKYIYIYTEVILILPKPSNILIDPTSLSLPPSLSLSPLQFWNTCTPERHPLIKLSTTNTPALLGQIILSAHAVLCHSLADFLWNIFVFIWMVSFSVVGHKSYFCRNVQCPRPVLTKSPAQNHHLVNLNISILPHLGSVLVMVPILPKWHLDPLLKC